MNKTRLLSCLLLAFSASYAADDACEASGGLSFVCGPKNAEDLVLVPDTHWVVASGMAPGTSLFLVNATDKAWTAFYPGDAPAARQDMARYGSCPGSPDPDGFIAHGLNLRPAGNDHSTLYVVGHGQREAIEVFDIDASGAQPTLTWVGCVMMPDGLDANSVASFSDGTLVATVLIHPDKTFEDAIAGRPTGAVYRWSPGDQGFEIIVGSELAANNGIEVSADESEIFVASSGLHTVVAFANSNPTRQLRTTGRFEFTPDNVHMGSDGRLITAGMIDDEPACGGYPSPEEFDIEKMAACPRGFVVKAIDPETMLDTDLARSPRHADFSNATMALPVGDEIWIGTFSGDRIGIH